MTQSTDRSNVDTAKLFDLNVTPDEYLRVIGQNPNVDAPNPDPEASGETALTLLCYKFYPGRSNLLALARMLLDHGADPGARDDTGYTPLHYAVMNNNVEMVNLLVKSRAPISTTKRGATPLTMVGVNTKKELVELLYDHAVSMKYDFAPADALAILRRLTGRPEFKAAMLLAENAFVDSVPHRPTLTLVSDHDTSVANLKRYLHDLVASMATALDKAAQAQDRSLSAMARLIQRALEGFERDALEAHGESVASAATWLGHAVSIEANITVGATSHQVTGWSPSQALWHRSFAMAAALASDEFTREEQKFLTAECEQVAFALSRALELYVIERFFNPCECADVASRLAAVYATLALKLVSVTTLPVRFPSGTKTHATYLTISSPDGGRTLDLAQHNFGILLDRYHTILPGRYECYPFVVRGVKPTALGPVFDKLVPMFSEYGHNLTSAAILPNFYQQLLKSGTVVADVAELSRKHLPFIQQLANNCSLYNLLSASAELAAATAPDPAAAVEKLHLIEVDCAQKLAAKAFGPQAVSPAIDVVVNCGELYRAILSRNDAQFAALLKKAPPASLSLLGAGGQTVLHLAARTNNIDYIRELLKAGAPMIAAADGALPIELCTHAAVAQLLLTSTDIREVDDDRYIFANTIDVYKTASLSGPVVFTLPEKSQFYVVRPMNNGDILVIAHFAGDKFVCGYISSKKYVKVVT